MKSFILLLSCTIFPYSLFADLYYFVKGFGDLGESFGFLPWLFALALVCSVAFLVLGIWQKWDRRKVALYNMIVKIMQIPAYIGIFVLGILCFSTLFTIGLAAVLFLFDCAAIFLTGLIGVTVVARCRADGVVSQRFAVVNGILQLIFCIDIISAIIIFMRAKNNPACANSMP